MQYISNPHLTIMTVSTPEITISSQPYSYTCNNPAGITDVDKDTCTHTPLPFISSAMSLLYSFTLTQVLPEEFPSLSPPVSETCADCLTAGVPGPL